MTISITENLKKKIKGSIRQRLPDVKISYNCILNVDGDYCFNDMDSIISLDKEHLKLLHNIISENPIRDFCSDWMGREFYEREFDEDANVRSLKEIDDIINHEKLSEEMVNDFLSLPGQYKVFFPLPTHLNNILGNKSNGISFGGGFEIVRWSDNYRKEYQNVYLHTTELNKITRELAEPGEKTRSETKIVLSIDYQGYFDKFCQSNSSLNVLDLIRSFLGMLFATGVVENSFRRQDKSSGAAFVYRTGANGVWYDGIIPAKGGLYSTISYLEPRYDSNLESNKNVHDIAISRLKRVFSSKKTERIILAARWAFDSISGDNELLSFIQATISLEILLGDKKHADQLSISDILSNRCAYMLGKDDESREGIIKNIKEIYSVRSEIVHRGKTRLRNEEKSHLFQLQMYVSRVIMKEIDLLKEK